MTGNVSAIARIYNKGGYIEGTGFLVLSSYVLTCAHVIKKALQLQEKTAIPQETVKLDFPQCSDLRAKVVFWQPCYSATIGGAKWGEDIAVLKIIEDLSSDIKPVKLDVIEVKRGDHINIYGFPEKYDIGDWVINKICGSVFNGWIEMEQISLSDPIIKGGFSGAPVWNKDQTTVLGMMVASDLGQEEGKKARAFAIPCSILVDNCLKFVQLGEILESLLSSSLINWQTIENAYLASRKNGLEKAIPSDIELMVKDFADEARLKLDKAQRSLDLERFVFELLKKSGGNKNQYFDDLTKWGQNYIDHFERLFQQEKNQQRIESKDEETICFLMLRFQENKQDRGNYELSAILVRRKSQFQVKEDDLSLTLEVNLKNKEELTLEEIHKLLPTIIEDLLIQTYQINKNHNYKRVKNIEIILFLPYALFNEYLEAIEIEEDELPIPLRAEYQVVFRSEKRLQETLQKTYKKLQKWENNWKQVEICCDESCKNHFKSDENGETWQAMFSKLESQGIGCGLSQKPSQEILKVFDRTGLAIAIWSKQILDSWNYQEELNKVLESSIIELPKTIKSKHQEAFAENDPEQHIGHHLTLLWENPYLLPPSVEYSNP
ncbi:MAG: trypsin-like peptidase domain-containing protein [Crocosphaera sp.]